MNRVRLPAGVLAGALALGALTGCGGQAGEGSSGALDLRVCIASEPATLDPAKNSTLDGAILAQHLFEGLMRWENSGEPTEGGRGLYLAQLGPGQAQSYEKTVHDDGTVTYTFTLREDLKWSDGTPLTAGDFVYSWRRLSDPATAADYCYMIDMVSGYEAVNSGEAEPTALGVSAPDERTFVVELTYDCPYFLEVCAFTATLPVREDVVEADPDGWTHDTATYLSNGPYRLAEWSHNSRIVLERNPSYYAAGDLGPGTITFQLMDDGTAILSAFRSGDLDFIKSVPVDEIPALLASGDLSIVDQLGTYYVSYNTQQAPFDDWRVRKAFTLAIDSRYLVENVTQTGQVPADAFVPYGVPDADPEGEDFRTVGGGYWTVPETQEQYAANVAEARELLAQAGYPGGAGFPVVVYSYNNDPSHEAIAQALQQQWQSALGVTVTLESNDWSAFLADRKAGNYQIARNSWVADYSDPCCFLDLWRTGSGNNDAQYSNPDYDALIDAAKAAADPAERMELLHQAEDLLMGEDWVLGPIYFYTQTYLLDPSLDGVYYTPLGNFFFGEVTRA